MHCKCKSAIQQLVLAGAGGNCKKAGAAKAQRAENVKATAGMCQKF